MCRYRYIYMCVCVDIYIYTSEPPKKQYDPQCKCHLAHLQPLMRSAPADATDLRRCRRYRDIDFWYYIDGYTNIYIYIICIYIYLDFPPYIYMCVCLFTLCKRYFPLYGFTMISFDDFQNKAPCLGIWWDRKNEDPAWHWSLPTPSWQVWRWYTDFLE
jgi:hypothetical protein